MQLNLPSVGAMSSKPRFHELGFIGAELRRPECVLATASGQILVPDSAGGVTVIEADSQRTVLASINGQAARLQPNSLALCADGTLLLAHMSLHEGGIWRMQADGAAEPYLNTIEGLPMPPTNFVLLDDEQRLWVTVSTRAVPRWPARRPGPGDGFVILADRRGARIVAQGLGFANELRVSPDGSELVVVETFARRLSRFPIRADGTLGDRSTLCEFGPGIWPDGIAYNAEGELLVASAFSNRLLIVDRRGRACIVVDQGDAAFVDALEKRHQEGELVKPGLIAVPTCDLGNCTSVAYCGVDLKNVAVGCLDGDRLACLDADVPGVPPVHWHWRF